MILWNSDQFLEREIQGGKRRTVMVEVEKYG